jgi:hypothetical protein
MDEDVRAVVRLVGGLIGPGQDRVRRVVRHWETSRRHRSGARAFARALVQKVPDATVTPAGPIDPAGPDGSPPGGQLVDEGRVEEGRAEVASRGAAGPPAGRRPRGPAGPPPGRNGSTGGPDQRRIRKLAAVGVGLAVGAAFGWVSGTESRPGHSGPGSVPDHSAVRSPIGVTPAAPDNGYVLRWGPGAHPVTVVGRWGCGPARPAVLDTVSGTVWTFSGWPSAMGSVRGTFLEKVAAASGLAAVAHGPHCDDLVVIRSRRPDLRLTLRGPT